MSSMSRNPHEYPDDAEREEEQQVSDRDLASAEEFLADEPTEIEQAIEELNLCDGDHIGAECPECEGLWCDTCDDCHACRNRAEGMA